MLTFFRRIRKSLLEGGRTSKYLIYAIGEIALVVIGILIALQINNWNETNKQKKEERRILIDLKNEINLAKESKIKYREHYQLKIDTLAHALDKLFSEDLQVLSTSECINVAMTHILNWEPPTISKIEELVAAGKIDLISSDELRSKIVLFRSKTENIESDLNRAISECTVLVDSYPKLIVRRWDPEIQSSTFECDDLTIKENELFLAQLQSNIGRTKALVRSSEEIITLLDDLNKLIK